MARGKTAQGWALLTSMAFVCTAMPGSAQVLRGTVLEAGGRVPVRDALLTLRDAGDSIVARAVSDEEGWFELRPGFGDLLHLEVSHLGYADWETANFALSSDTDLEVEVRLSIEAIPIEALTVATRANRNTRRLAGFDRRRENPGFGGHFLNAEDIERRPMARPSTLVLEAPGMSVRGGGGPFDLNQIYSGDCPANVFVDGVRIEQRLHSVDQYLSIDRIAGVEVYPRGMSTPPQYQDALRRQCGAVLFWTKELRPDTPGAWNPTRVALGVGLLAGLLTIGFVR